MTEPRSLPTTSSGDILPISKPASYMVESGVHPHISHEHDVPQMVRKMVDEVDRLGREVERHYDVDKNTTWREHAKALAGRVGRQRGEIARLHKKVRDLRADIHERDERIAELEGES